MKIPSSSSMVWATLAISASSTSLAAPTNGDIPNAEATLTSSPSGNRIASRRGSFARGDRPTNMQEDIDLARAVAENHLVENRGLLDPLLGGLLCPIITPILDCREPAGAKKDAKQGKQSAFETTPSTPISPQDAVDRFRAAIAIIEMNQQASDPSYTPSDNSNSPSDSGADNRDAHVGVDGDDSTPQDDSPSPPPNTPDISSSTAPSSSVWVPSSTSSTAPSSTSSAASSSLALRDLPSSLPVSAPIAMPLPTTLAAAPVGVANTVPANPVTDKLAGVSPDGVNKVTGELGALPVDVSPATKGASAAVIVADASSLAQDAVSLAMGNVPRAAPAPVAAPATVISVIEGKASDVAAAPSSANAAPSTVAGKAPGPIGAAAGGAASKVEGEAPVMVVPEKAGGVIQTGASTGGSNAGKVGNTAGGVASSA